MKRSYFVSSATTTTLMTITAANKKNNEFPDSIMIRRGFKQGIDLFLNFIIQTGLNTHCAIRHLWQRVWILDLINTRMDFWAKNI